MRKAPRISVLVPSHNHGRFLREGLDSALDQSLPPHEIVVVDDGSTDETREILRSYATRVRVFERTRHGIGATYNFAVRQATGDWLAFLESDDVLEPGYLEACADFVAAHRVLWVSTARRLIDEHGVPTGEFAGKNTPGPLFTPEGFLLRDMGTSSTPYVQREALDAVGRFSEETYAVDSDMALRFSVRYPMGYIERPLYRYRRHGHNASGAVLKDARELLAILRRFEREEQGWVHAHEPIMQRALAKFCGRVASQALAADGQAAGPEALALLREAIHLDPRKVRHWRRWLALRLLGPRIASCSSRLHAQFHMGKTPGSPH